ncbi:MAG: S-layer homology domain-containing protein [Clostridiaceae bacterium]|nr:S-layer homology domain-containing protein [Clostridiaceae bacterium]
MKKRLTGLLSFWLALAMLCTVLVVPAAAADPELPLRISQQPAAGNEYTISVEIYDGTQWRAATDDDEVQYAWYAAGDEETVSTNQKFDEGSLAGATFVCRVTYQEKTVTSNSVFIPKFQDGIYYYTGDAELSEYSSFPQKYKKIRLYYGDGSPAIGEQMAGQPQKSSKDNKALTGWYLWYSYSGGLIVDPIPKTNEGQFTENEMSVASWALLLVEPRYVAMYRIDPQPDSDTCTVGTQVYTNGAYVDTQDASFQWYTWVDGKAAAPVTGQTTRTLTTGEKNVQYVCQVTFNPARDKVILLSDPITWTKEIYTVTVTSGSASPSGAQPARTSITIKADAPADGMRFAGWEGTDGLTFTSGSAKTATATFLMPERDVTVKATYEKIPYTVTVTSGSASPSGAQPAGTSITIKADAPADGMRFAGWEGTEGLTFTSGSAATATATFQMPERDVTVKATYEKIPYIVTVTSGSASPSGAQPAGTSITIKADAPADGMRFAGWEGTEGLTFTSGSAATATATFQMPERDVTVKATYEAVHTHAGTKVEGKPATCTEDGWKDYYECSCGLYFTDADCTDEIADLDAWKVGDGKIEATSHTFNPNWSYDRINHWHAALCGHDVVADLSVHVFGKDHICDICGYMLPVQMPEIYLPIVVPSEHGDVTFAPKAPVKNDIVTIKPVPDDGYEVESVTVTDPYGRAIPTVDNGYGTYCFVQPGCRVTIAVTFRAIETSTPDCPRDASCPMAGYTDLNMRKWYHDGVHYCLESKLMIGTDRAVFEPETVTTRAMLVTILWRLEGCPAGKAALPCEDVAADAWYADAVRWAQAAGIVEGYSDTLFGPDDVLTREQMVTILYRYAQYKACDVSVGENTNILSYGDAFEVSEWAIPAMQWACGSGIIIGISDGDILNLAPAGNTSRAEMAAILSRYCEGIIQ